MISVAKRRLRNCYARRCSLHFSRAASCTTYTISTFTAFHVFSFLLLNVQTDPDPIRAMPDEQNANTNLDQDLKQSRRQKYDNPQLQKDVKQWIVSILNDGNKTQIDVPTFLNGDLLGSLKDGNVLCMLVNTIYGEGSLKFKQSRMAFVQMENIEKFLNFCKQHGVPQDELFQTIDLYEENDPYQVILSLQSFSRMVHKQFPNKYQIIGPAIATKRPRPNVPPKPKNLVLGQGGVPWSSIEYGYMNGSNQGKEGLVFGSRRDVVPKGNP